MLCDYHIHTTFSDGKNTPEEIVTAAIAMGLDEIGFSDHAHTAFDESYCMMPDDYPRYIGEIGRLKEKYAGKIRILCGIEQDIYSDMPTDGFDYVIGSVHYLKTGDEFTAVDHRLDITKECINGFFGGDSAAFAEAYFGTVSEVCERTGCGIIGHFDLVTKFQEREPMLDTSDPRYVSAWKKAADRLLSYNVPFEINTGAIARGYRTTPYPSDEMILYIKKNGGRLILSSDCHDAGKLCLGFDGLRQ